MGTSDANHWGAWLVQAEVVSAHIEPPLQLMCDALTTQYLRPVLVENGMTEDQAEQYVVWYDVSDLIIQANKSADAQALYAAKAISAKAVREAVGFDESDAPQEETDDPAIAAAFAMVQVDPGLMLRPGLDIILEQLKALLSGSPLPAIDGASETVAAKAVSGPNVEDRDDPTIEPVSPPATPAVPGAAPAAKPANNPGGVPQTSPGAPMPQNGPGGTPGNSMAKLSDLIEQYRPSPAPELPTEPEPRDVAFNIVGSSSQYALQGSLSQMLAELDDRLESAPDDVLDLTGL
jgi:hypothetical protein